MTVHYELKKLLLKRRGIAMISIALLLKIIALICGSDATVINTKMEENKSVFLSYMQELSGEINDEKISFINNEEESFTRAQTTFAQTEQQYLNGNCSELEFLQALDDFEAAKEKQEAFSVVQGQYISAQSDNQRYFMYTNGWARLLAGTSTDWILILLICIITAPVVCAEHSTEMAQLLAVTKNGKERLYLSKLIAILTMVVIISCIFFLSEIIYAQLHYGLQNPHYPLKTIPQFANTEYDVSVIQAMHVMTASRLLGICYLAVLLFFAATRLKKPLPSIFIGLSSVFLPTLLLTESELQYTLPLPVGMLKSCVYLQSTFNASRTSDVVITLTKNEYISTVSIIVILTAVVALLSVIKLDVKRLSIFVLCLCMSVFSACADSSEYNTDRIYNSYDSVMISSNEDYTVEILQGVPILYDKSSGEQIELIRTPFEETAITACAAVYADDTAVYRLEQISDSSINGNSLYTERIVKTNLSDFSETVVYCDEILKDSESSFLGLGSYLPSEEPSLDCSIRSFVIFDDVMIMLKENGLHRINIGENEGERLADGQIRSWSAGNGYVYYIDFEYILHRIDLKTKCDDVICDERVSDIYLTETAIYARSISNGGTVIAKSVDDGNWGLAEEDGENLIVE